MSYASPPAPLPATGEVNFSRIGEGFNLYLRHWAPFAGVTALLVIPPLLILVPLYVALILSTISAAGSQAGSNTLSPASGALMVAFPLVGILLLGLIPIAVSLSHMAEKAVSGGTPVFNDWKFGYQNNPMATILAFFLIMVMVYIGMFLCILPGLYVAYVTALAFPYMARGRGSWEAISQSFQTMKGGGIMAVLFVFVANLLAGLGANLLIIGAIFTYPLYFIWLEMLRRDLEGFSAPVGETLRPN